MSEAYLTLLLHAVAAVMCLMGDCQQTVNEADSSFPKLKTGCQLPYINRKDNSIYNRKHYILHL